MSTYSNSDMVSALNWRYATKQFDASKKLDSETQTALEEALRLAPSSFGMQPWKFVVVESDEIKAKLRPESWDQPQITDCSSLIVLAARSAVNQDDIDTFIKSIAEARNTTVEELAGYQGMIEGFTGNFDDATRLNWAAKQTYIALGQLMTAAAALKVDTCPLEGINPAKYDEILGLEGSGYQTVVACALGYRSEEDKYAAAPKVRYAAEEVIIRK